MADKIIHLRIDVKKLIKDYFFNGEKGTYADMVLFYNEEQDQYGANGMIVQSIPKAIVDKEKSLPKEQKTKGPILGNAKVWANTGSRESIPGGEQATTTAAAASAPQVADDLPF